MHLYIDTPQLRLISDENDFTHQMYTELFAVGTTFPATQCIDISTTQDDFLEGAHEFTVSIESTMPNDAVTISAPSSHVVTIDDDDGTYVTCVWLMKDRLQSFGNGKVL